MSRFFLALFLIISTLYISPLNACVGKMTELAIPAVSRVVISGNFACISHLECSPKMVRQWPSG